MTPACKLLLSNKINFSTHEYEHDPSHQHYGLEAVEKLGIDATETFKTLLVTDGKSHFVAVLPVAYQLNLKKVAQVFSCKKLMMAEAKNAERLTGYLVGGISPLAQKKKLATVIDVSAKSFEKIYVSGGKRGLDIALSAQDLANLLKAEFANIIDE